MSVRYENEASVARLRERELQGSLNSIKANSAQAGGEEVQLRALEREANSQRQLLETYLSRFRESASRGGTYRCHGRGFNVWAEARFERGENPRGDFTIRRQ